MNPREILRFIDSGANYYISLFGKAEHMQTVVKPHYSYVQPVGDAHGIRFVFSVQLEGLSPQEKKAVIGEIRALNMPVWVDLLSEDDVFFDFFGRKKVHGQREFGENDEVYMAMLPGGIPCPEYREDLEIRKISLPEDFALWAEINNAAFAGGFPDIHPVYHYELCRQGLMECYLLLCEGKPASIAAIMNHEGIASLEFVATVPGMQRRGFAEAICAHAVSDAFGSGAKIVTVRAINRIASKLYEKAGFRAYNFAI